MQRLGLFEEVTGHLSRLEEVQGGLIAEIARLEILLPPELGDKLRPHLGQRVGVLRVEDGYRLRQADPKTHQPTHMLSRGGGRNGPMPQLDG